MLMISKIKEAISNFQSAPSIQLMKIMLTKATPRTRMISLAMVMLNRNIKVTMTVMRMTMIKIKATIRLTLAQITWTDQLWPAFPFIAILKEMITRLLLMIMLNMINFLVAMMLLFVILHLGYP